MLTKRNKVFFNKKEVASFNINCTMVFMLECVLCHLRSMNRISSFGIKSVQKKLR